MRLTRRNVGIWIVCLAACSWLGVVAAHAVSSAPETLTHTRTLRTTEVQTVRHVVTVRVRGHVIGHHDHVLVVFVPRIVVRTPSGARRVVPPHVVRVRQSQPLVGVTSAVIGVAPPGETVTVTVPIPVAVTGPTVTTTVTATVPGPTSTVTVTITTIPLQDSGGSR